MSTTPANPDVVLAVETGRQYVRNRECQLRFRVTNEADGPRDVSLQVVLRGSKDKLEQDDTEAEQHCRLCDPGDQAILSFSFLPRVAGEFALKSWRLVVGHVDDPAQSNVYELPGQDLHVCIASSRNSSPAQNIKIGDIHIKGHAKHAGDNRTRVNVNIPAARSLEDEPRLLEWQPLRVRFGGREARIACGFPDCGRPLAPRGNFTCDACDERMCRHHQDAERQGACLHCADQLREEEFQRKSRKVPHPSAPEKAAAALNDIVQRRPVFDGRIWTSRSMDPITRDIQSLARTSKNSYTIGEEFTLNVQAERDCYVTILDLGTSGNLFVLLKNYRLKANVPQALSGPDSQTAWRVGGPTGIERMKAMFTVQPLNVFPGADCFTLLNLMGQADALEKIRTLYASVNSLAPDSWTDAGCEFVIQDAPT